MEGAIASNQKLAVGAMEAIQKQLLEETEYGRKVASQSNEIQEAIKTLQAAGKELDRTRLLEILIEAPSTDRLNALVSFTRPGLDYLFFQSLTERIEKCSGEERKKLETLRTNLLEITRKIDLHAEEEFKHAEALLEELISAENPEQATSDHLDEISDIFIQVLNRSLQEANKKNDVVRMPKLQQIASVVQKASAPPPELALLEEMLASKDDVALNQLIEQHVAEITPEFHAMVASVVARTEEKAGEKPTGEEAQLLERLQLIYRASLKLSMKKNLG
jgi:hypothetical protein